MRSNNFLNIATLKEQQAAGSPTLLLLIVAVTSWVTYEFFVVVKMAYVRVFYLNMASDAMWIGMA